MVRWHHSSRRHRRAVLFFAAILAVAIPVPAVLAVGHHLAITRAEQRVAGVAAEVERHTAVVLGRAFDDLRQLAGAGLDPACDEATRRILAEAAYRSGIYREVGMLDAEARLRCTNQFRPPEPIVLPPELRTTVFDAVRAGEGVALGSIQPVRFKGETVAVGVPVADAGAVYVLIHPRVLAEPFRDAALGDDGFVVVRDERGAVMSTAGPGAPATSGKGAEPPSGWFRYEVRHTGAPTPFSVEVAVSPGTLSSGWREDRSAVMAGGVLLSAALLFAVVMAARRGLSFVADLRTALARDELEVRYQPIFDLAVGTCTGCEALVRWRHPERGAVEPELFVPLAESAGLIEAVTDFVVARALGELGPTLRGRPQMELGFNVSAPMLADDRFFRMLIERVRDAGVNPQQIVLEVTEREVVDSREQGVVERLERLRGHGFRLGLDDFGIGYSTLGFLRDGGFQVLKIDRSFVAAIGSDSPFANLVDRIVEIGLSYDLEVIAEGIERDAQLEHLRSLGCPRGQGYLLAGPVKAETLVEGVKSGCQRGTVEGGDDDLSR